MYSLSMDFGSRVKDKMQFHGVRLIPWSNGVLRASDKRGKFMTSDFLRLENMYWYWREV